MLICKSVKITFNISGKVTLVCWGNRILTITLCSSSPCRGQRQLSRYLNINASFCCCVAYCLFRNVCVYIIVAESALTSPNTLYWCCPAETLFWSPQGAECGEGLQRRNLSCVVHWGGQRSDSPPRPVGAELCGDELVRSIQQDMERPCFVPCPGEGAAETPR